MTTEQAIQRIGEVEALAVRANEEGMPLSPLLVLAVCEGRFHLPPAQHLSHDLPRPESADHVG